MQITIPGSAVPNYIKVDNCWKMPDGGFQLVLDNYFRWCVKDQQGIVSPPIAGMGSKNRRWFFNYLRNEPGKWPLENFIESQMIAEYLNKQIGSDAGGWTAAAGGSRGPLLINRDGDEVGVDKLPEDLVLRMCRQTELLWIIDLLKWDKEHSKTLCPECKGTGKVELFTSYGACSFGCKEVV